MSDFFGVFLAVLLAILAPLCAQLLYFALYYLSLALPVFFSGLAVGGLLAARPEMATRVYAANLAGSAV